MECKVGFWTLSKSEHCVTAWDLLSSDLTTVLAAGILSFLWLNFVWVPLKEKLDLRAFKARCRQEALFRMQSIRSRSKSGRYNFYDFDGGQNANSLHEALKHLGIVALVQLGWSVNVAEQCGPLLEKIRATDPGLKGGDVSDAAAPYLQRIHSILSGTG
jgi:hypothetical protein